MWCRHVMSLRHAALTHKLVHNVFFFTAPGIRIEYPR
jgi:hypothetical protein